MKWISYLPTLTHALILLILTADAFGSSDKISNYFALSSREIMVFVIIEFIALRLTKHRVLDTYAAKINHIVATGTLAAAAVLAVINYMASTNFVFAATRIQVTQLLVIGIYTGIVSLLTLSDRWYDKYYRQIIYFSAPAIMTLFLIVTLLPFNILVIISQEDHLIENLQVLVLLAASVISAYITRRLINKQRLLGILFIFFALTLFVFAGEEISWGQRIFHITTPAYLTENNAQKEINIHNLSAMGTSVNLSYIILGFYGMVAWIVQKILPRLEKIPFIYLIPPWYTVGYYFVGFLYNFYIRLGDHRVGEWSEYVELMLYTAVLCTMIGWSKLLPKHTSNIKV